MGEAAGQSSMMTSGLPKRTEAGVGVALGSPLHAVPTADSLGERASGFLGTAVPEFCEMAGVDVDVLEPGAAEVELVDFFTLLEDPTTARFIAADPGVRIKLAVALIRL